MKVPSGNVLCKNYGFRDSSCLSIDGKTEIKSEQTSQPVPIKRKEEMYLF